VGAQHRDSCRAYVSTVMNLPIPLNARNVLISWGTGSFSRRTPCFMEMIGWLVIWLAGCWVGRSVDQSVGWLFT